MEIRKANILKEVRISN